MMTQEKMKRAHDSPSGSRRRPRARAMRSTVRRLDFSARLTSRCLSSALATSTETTRTLKQSMTALVRLVHPDVLASTHPELSKANAEALAHLQGTLDHVRRARELPGAKVRRLTFYVRDAGAAESADDVRAVPFTLRTTGGDCRNVVRRDLGSLFASVGIEREFEWDDGDWRTTRTAEEEAEERRRRNEYAETSREYGEPEVAQAYREQTGARVSTREQSKDVHEAIKVLDPLFEGIAAVAWLRDASENADEGERKRLVMYEAIPHLVREGWNLKGETMEAIWRGERDEKILLDGLDGGSALAVLSILKHAKNLDRLYGPPPARK